jgi:hypothetical protein
MLFKHDYCAHRMAWLLMTGSWPADEIDHINHVKDDNRWGNLREATHQQNMKNQKMSRLNVSGYTGVSWHRGKKLWEAYIHGDVGKIIPLGSYIDLEAAVAARRAAEIKYDYHPNHGQQI